MNILCKEGGKFFLSLVMGKGQEINQIKSKNNDFGNVPLPLNSQNQTHPLIRPNGHFIFKQERILFNLLLFILQKI